MNVTTNNFMLFAIVQVTNWLLIDVKCILRTSMCYGTMLCLHSLCIIYNQNYVINGMY